MVWGIPTFLLSKAAPLAKKAAPLVADAILPNTKDTWFNKFVEEDEELQLIMRESESVNEARLGILEELQKLDRELKGKAVALSLLKPEPLTSQEFDNRSKQLQDEIDAKQNEFTEKEKLLSEAVQQGQALAYKFHARLLRVEKHINDKESAVKKSVFAGATATLGSFGVAVGGSALIVPALVIGGLVAIGYAGYRFHKHGSGDKTAWGILLVGVLSLVVAGGLAAVAVTAPISVPTIAGVALAIVAGVSAYRWARRTFKAVEVISDVKDDVMEVAATVFTEMLNSGSELVEGVAHIFGKDVSPNSNLGHFAACLTKDYKRPVWLQDTREIELPMEEEKLLVHRLAFSPLPLLGKDAAKVKVYGEGLVMHKLTSENPWVSLSTEHMQKTLDAFKTEFETPREVDTISPETRAQLHDLMARAIGDMSVVMRQLRELEVLAAGGAVESAGVQARRAALQGEYLSILDALDYALDKQGLSPAAKQRYPQIFLALGQAQFVNLAAGQELEKFKQANQEYIRNVKLLKDKIAMRTEYQNATEPDREKMLAALDLIIKASQDEAGHSANPRRHARNSFSSASVRTEAELAVMVGGSYDVQQHNSQVQARAERYLKPVTYAERVYESLPRASEPGICAKLLKVVNEGIGIVKAKTTLTGLSHEIAVAEKLTKELEEIQRSALLGQYKFQRMLEVIESYCNYLDKQGNVELYKVLRPIVDRYHAQLDYQCRGITEQASDEHIQRREQTLSNRSVLAKVVSWFKGSTGVSQVKSRNPALDEETQAFIDKDKPRTVAITQVSELERDRQFVAGVKQLGQGLPDKFDGINNLTGRAMAMHHVYAARETLLKLLSTVNRISQDEHPGWLLWLHSKVNSVLAQELKDKKGQAQALGGSLGAEDQQVDREFIELDKMARAIETIKSRLMQMRSGSLPSDRLISDMTLLCDYIKDVQPRLNSDDFARNLGVFYDALKGYAEKLATNPDMALNPADLPAFPQDLIKILDNARGECQRRHPMLSALEQLADNVEVVLKDSSSFNGDEKFQKALKDFREAMKEDLSQEQVQKKLQSACQVLLISCSVPGIQAAGEVPLQNVAQLEAQAAALQWDSLTKTEQQLSNLLAILETNHKKGLNEKVTATQKLIIEIQQALGKFKQEVFSLTPEERKQHLTLIEEQLKQVKHDCQHLLSPAVAEVSVVLSTVAETGFKAWVAKISNALDAISNVLLYPLAKLFSDKPNPGARLINTDPPRTLPPVNMSVPKPNPTIPELKATLSSGAPKSAATSKATTLEEAIGSMNSANSTNHTRSFK